MTPVKRYRTDKQIRHERQVRAKRAAVLGVLLLAVGLGWWYWHWTPEVEEEEEFYFIQTIDYPAWFAESFLNLPEDLQRVRDAGKQGLVLYFARQNCACCELMMEVNFNDPYTVAYMQRYFDVVAVDAWGHMPVVDFDGQKYTEARYAKLMAADATPSLLFFNLEGEKILQLRGYYSPYQFQAILDFVLGERSLQDPKHYFSYLERPQLFDEFELHDHPLFAPPPYYLDRSRVAGERPLAVLFERGNCPGCDLLHAHLLKQPEVLRGLEQMDVVQLDLDADTPLITPDGQPLSSRLWAEQLDIDYVPTLLFFDHDGQLLQRVDSASQLRQLETTLHGLLPPAAAPAAGD